MNKDIQVSNVMISDMESLLIDGDLSKLNGDQRVIFYRKTCDSMGLNYLTQPFAYIKLNGKLVLYARKDATEQLRKIHKVSITKMESKTVEGVYIVTVYARSMDGQEDVSTGAVTIKGLQGDALANAFLKAETKAKRRVTLSICGLGFTDESEIETIPNAQFVKCDSVTGEIISPTLQEPHKPNEMDMHVLMDSLSLMDSSQSLDLLQEVFTKAYKKSKSVPSFLEKLVECKDKNKVRLEALIPISEILEDIEEEDATLSYPKIDDKLLEGNPY
jgi:hypothetical protein